MYEQIARNKRRTVVYVAGFVLAWLLAGAAVGRLAGSGSADVLTGMVLAAVLALIGVAFSLIAGRWLVLALAGAKPADAARYPQLVHLVEALAIGEGLPLPAVYVVEDDSPNAFATGLSPDRAAITVTTGLLARMDREELEGVLAHEFSHIRNYDTRLLLIVSTLVGMAGLLAGWLWRSAFLMRGRGRDSAQVTLVFLAAGALLAVLGWLLGPLVRLGISRRRESLADASSVELTRNPVGLIRALRELAANDQPLRQANHMTAAMCIDDPLQHHSGWVHQLYDTHPPIRERIAALERMAHGSTV